MLSVRLFGGLALYWQDHPLPVIPGKAARSLLAYLLVHRQHAHTRDLLAGTFWPNLPEDVARRRLSQALWQIRNSLQAILAPQQSASPTLPPLILAESDTLQIHPRFPVWLDVDDFNRALELAMKVGEAAIAQTEAALALYTGEFLEGYYEDWAVAMREQLRLKLLEALAHLVKNYKHLGDYERALACALRLVAEEPWHEAGQREVMRLCHLLGRDAEALKHFEDCRKLLASEMGVEPAPETLALAQEIARHNGDAVVTDLPETPASPAPLFFERDRALKLPLVGRETEREALLAQIEALMQGLGGLVSVEGEAGVGKTRLLQTLAQDAEWRGVEVLWGAGREGARATPYASLIEALSARLTPLRAGQLAQLVAGIWLQVLKPLLPPLAAQLPDLPPPPQLDPAQEKSRLPAALAYFLEGWSQIAPLLLILEDLHWAGEDTLELLAQLFPMLCSRQPLHGGRRVLIVVSFRSSEARAQPGIWKRLQALDRAGAQTRLALAGLSAEATGELVRRSLGLANVARLFEARLYRETQGNPLFVLETLRNLHSQGVLTQDGAGNWNTPWDATTADYAELPLPQAVEQTITRRLELLSPAQRQAIHLAAVMGDRCAFDVFSAACDHDAQTLLTILHELVLYRFLDEMESDYGFSHDKVRQVVYAEIVAPARLAFHRRVAQALETLHPERVAALAYHWTRAEAWEQAAIYQRQAGGRARTVYANAEATNHYTQALAALDRLPGADPAQRCALLLAREALYDVMGEREAQAGDLAALSALAAAQDDAALRARISLRRANYSHATGDYGEALAAAQEVVRLAQTVGDPELHAAGYRHWGRILWHKGDFDEAQSRLKISLDLAQAHALRALEAQCLCDLGAIAGQRGDYGQATAYFFESLHIDRALDDRQAEGLILNNLGITARMQGNYDQALTYHEQSLQIRREVGHLRGESSVLNSLGIISRHRGDYALAKDYFEQALRIMRMIGERWFECRTLNNLAACLINLGDYSSARAHFERSLQICREIGDRSSKAVIMEGMGTIYYALGDNLAALEQIQEALRIVNETGEPESTAYILIQQGAILTALGRLEEAATAYRQAVALRRDLAGSPQTIEPLAGLAHVCLQQGDLDQAQRHVNELLHHLDAGPPTGVENPARVYLTCYQVLGAGGDPRAPQALASAYDMIRDRAARITDAAMRRSFLENVAANQEVVSAYRALQIATYGKQTTVSLPRADAPPGRPLREDEYVAVTWMLEAPDDSAIRHKVARRRHRLLRLLREAQSQGALPRDEDLAAALDVGLSTLRRDVAALRAANHELSPRRRKRTNRE